MKEKYLQIIIVLFFLFGTILCSYSQSIENKGKKTHSPRKATIFSTIVPGLGQAYNKKYWKIPVIYAGIGAFAYLSIDNNNEFNRFKTAYKQRIDGETDEFYGILNDQALLNEMDRWRKFRDYCIVGGLVFYILQIVDANVDANLYDFDVSDDLSLRILPDFRSNYGYNTPTLELKIVKKF